MPDPSPAGPGPDGPASRFATVALSISLLLLTFTAVWMFVAAPLIRSQRPVAASRVADWERLASTGHWVGPRDAGVVIMVFSDYECPYCRAGEVALRAIQEAHPDDVAVVYKHFPLQSVHRRAYRAARFAACAAEQGAFSSVHARLYEAAASSGLDARRTAEESEVPDPGRFVACADQTSPVARVEQDLSDGREIRVSKTPTYVINGMLLHRNPGSADFVQLVERAIEGDWPESPLGS